MSLDLDKRQRAMLREMGVRVWQPPAAEPHAAAVPAAATVAVAAPAPVEKPAAATAAPKPATVLEAAVPPSATTRTLGVNAAGGASWQLGSVQTLYAAQTAAAASPVAGHTRWLLLLESADALAADPLVGDAGKLLDNMLRAARRHTCGQPTFCAALARTGAGEAESGAVQSALAEAMAQTRPDVVLIMGRLAAQAVLGSAEPLGKLRGQVHELMGTPAVVTYDASYLLRSLPDKAKAWDDLCRVMALAPKS